MSAHMLDRRAIREVFQVVEWSEAQLALEQHVSPEPPWEPCADLIRRVASCLDAKDVVELF